MDCHGWSRISRLPSRSIASSPEISHCLGLLEVTVLQSLKGQGKKMLSVLKRSYPDLPVRSCRDGRSETVGLGLPLANTAPESEPGEDDERRRRHAGIRVGAEVEQT